MPRKRKEQEQETENREAATPKPKLICIDAGHGGKESGIIAHGMMEKEITLRAALALEKALKKAGFQTMLTRREDLPVGVGTRVGIANAANADLFLSLHCGAGANHVPCGAQVIYCPVASGLDLYLEEAVWKAYGDETDWSWPRIGIEYVLQHTSMPAVIVSMGYLTNAEDAERLRGDYPDKLAAALAQAIKENFGDVE